MSWGQIGSLMDYKSGKTYPSAELYGRKKLYDRYEALYQGRHKEIYVHIDGYTYDTSRPYIYMNLLAEITNLIVDRLFGEDIIIETQDETTDEWINNFLQDNNYKNLLMEFGKLTSYCGNSILKAIYDSEEK